MISAILGLVTGLGGTLVTGWLNLKAQREKNAHEVSMIKAETEAMKAEAEMHIQVERERVHGEIEIADAAAYTESQKQGNKNLFSSKWVERLLDNDAGFWKRLFGGLIAFPLCFLFGLTDILKGLMRPVLTGYLVGVTTWITWMAWKIVQRYGQGMTAIVATEIFQEIVHVVVYLTVSCVTWWFGDRRTAKFLMRLNDGNRTDV